MKRFVPMYDRVVVQVDPVKEKMIRGIVQPETVEWVVQEGEVIAVGPGAPRESLGATVMQLKVGDRVLVSNAAGHPANDGMQDLVVVREKDVLAVIVEEDEEVSSSPSVN